MLSAQQLQLALDLQSRSYKLLRWLVSKIDAGELSLPRVVASRHADNVLAATLDWMEPCHQLFPPEMQPPAGKMREFAAFFGTYLTSSFDLAKERRLLLRNHDGGNCFCRVCASLVNGSHLKAKKLTARDKQRAASLMLARLVELAQEHQLSLSVTGAEAMLTQSPVKMDAAYSTYGYWLIQRTQGVTDGPSILALWRQIAWTETGAPRKNFELNCRSIQESEERLLKSIPSFASSTMS